MSEVEVTQVDRDAASSYLTAADDAPDTHLDALSIRNGWDDEDHLVQAFARHRLQSEAAVLTKLESPTVEMVEAGYTAYYQTKTVGEHPIANAFVAMLTTFKDQGEAK